MYSQRILHETIAGNNLQYDRISRGILYFHRSQESLEKGISHMQILADDGQEIRLLDRTQVVELEPSWPAGGHGRHLLPTDETGDCSRFTPSSLPHASAVVPISLRLGRSRL
jgi:D-amino-acid dehydrogenase